MDRKPRVQYSLTRELFKKISENENDSAGSKEPLTEYRKAVKSDDKAIVDLVHKTVRKIYPRHHPAEMVEFFCMHHNRKRTIVGN